MKHKLEKEVQAQLQRAGVSPNQTVLLALSGGRDSVVLGEILYQLGQSFAVAHVNYQLRGTDAATDAKWVEQLCRKWNCSFFLKKSNREALGANVQQGARKVRYDWMRALCHEHHFSALLTAHHQADQAETFLLAAMKGRGSKGMAGMRVFDGLLLRPLLHASVDMVAAYAAEKNLLWREDTSNASLKYDRNFVRHQLLAQAKKRFPQLDQLLAREAERLQQLEAIAAEQVALWRNRLVMEMTDDYQCWTWVDLPSSYASWVLGRLAAENGLEQSAIEAFLELTHKAPGKKLQAAGWTVVRTRVGADWFKNLQIEPFSVAFGGPGVLITPNGKLEVRLTNIFEEDAAYCMPCDDIEPDLAIRSWQPGDRINIADNTHKKISDLLQEQRINHRDRHRTLVLASGRDVLWVIGLRKRIFEPSVEPALGWLVFNWLP